MKMNKNFHHTPGPWIVRQDPKFFTLSEVVTQTGGRVIDEGFASNDEEQGNAYLIAAAPDGLEAAIEARAEIRRINEAAGETIFNPAVTSMLDIFIAKATGGAR